VKRPRIFAEVRHTAAWPFAINRGLQRTAADRASQNELEPSLTWFGLAARFPREPEIAARTGERLRLDVAAARPRSDVLPDHRRLIWAGSGCGARGQEKGCGDERDEGGEKREEG